MSFEPIAYKCGCLIKLSGYGIMPISCSIKSKNLRVYWAQLKRRNPRLSTICRQLKLTATVGKRCYNGGMV